MPLPSRRLPVWRLSSLAAAAALGCQLSLADTPRPHLSDTEADAVQQTESADEPTAIADELDDVSTPILDPNSQYLTVSNTALVASPEARKRFQYLVSCALAENVVMVAEVAAERFEFRGSMGLAPDWGRRALTPSEERWVSACMLARTNYYGETVLLSMRNETSEHPALHSDETERETFDVYEAGFFGNIFLPFPQAYVCSAPLEQQTERQQALLKTHKRICSLPSGSSLTSKYRPELGQMSQCGFIRVAPCLDGAAPMAAEESWQEVIHVWLAAEPPASESALESRPKIDEAEMSSDG